MKPIARWTCTKTTTSSSCMKDYQREYLARGISIIESLFRVKFHKMDETLLNECFGTKARTGFQIYFSC